MWRYKNDDDDDNDKDDDWEKKIDEWAGGQIDRQID